MQWRLQRRGRTEIRHKQGQRGLNRLDVRYEKEEALEDDYKRRYCVGEKKNSSVFSMLNLTCL